MEAAMEKEKTTITLTLVLLLLLSILGACGNAGTTVKATGYTHITQEEAKKIMSQKNGHVIVDVRRQDEYKSGHIPGAVLIPNESIKEERPKELPDPEQIILIYCRSGNRSKQAAQKLAKMGYKKVYEFGGLNSWTGEVVK